MNTSPPPPSEIYSARVRVIDTGLREVESSTSVRGTPDVSVVVPVFNEQETLPTLYRRLTATLRGAGTEYEIVFVDDGSQDRTPDLLDELAANDAAVTVAHLSRNFGHQPAVTAGLNLARGRAVAVMDGDLQDPPEVLPRLIARWRAGTDVVYAIRTCRKEGPGHRLGYWAFYRLLRGVSDVDVPLDAGDFCLMDRRVVAELVRMPEREPFVRGLRAFVGFRQAGVEYERETRFAGRPKYTLAKLFGLAVSGLVGFSGFPLRAIVYAGVGSVVIGLALSGIAFADAMIRADDPRTWLVLLAVAGLGTGVQLCALGIVGEYVRRILTEVRGRPTYIVRDVVRQPTVTEEPARARCL